MPPLRFVSVAVSPDQQTRRGVRARARLVLQFRIPAGHRPRLRRLRGPDDHGLFRNRAEEGREHHLLGVARRNGLDENHRGGLRRLHCAPHAQDRLHQLPRTLGAAVRDPPPGQPDGGGLGLSVARGFGPPDLRLAAGHHPVAEPQGGLHRRPRHAGARHAGRHVRRERFGGGRRGRPAVVLLDPSAARSADRREEDLETLRRGHETGARIVQTGRRGPCRAQRQRAGVGLVRRGSPHVDELRDRRPFRHPAQRLSGGGQRLVVQRRPLRSPAGRRGGRHEVREGVGETARTHRGVVQRTLPPARRLPGRLRGLRRRQHGHPPEHDRRLRAALQDARRADPAGGDPHGAAAPPHAEGPALALAPQPALQGFAGGYARRTRLRGQERVGMAVAAVVLRQRLLRHRRRRLSAAGRGDSRRIRGGHPDLRHRFDRRTVRRRSSVRAARSHFAGVERRGRAGHLRHDPRTQTGRDTRKVGKTHKKSESEDCEGSKKRW